MAVLGRSHPRGRMNPGDSILWIDIETGREYSGKYVGSFGGRSIIETTTPTGHLGLRYVDPRHIRRADNGSPTQPENT